MIRHYFKEFNEVEYVVSPMVRICGCSKGIIFDSFHDSSFVTSNKIFLVQSRVVGKTNDITSNNLYIW